MLLTFVTHPSFLLEGEKLALLFDYFGEGEVPKTDKELVVLSSHSHQDHYNKVIFSLNAKEYILSDTIKLKDVPANKRERTKRFHAGEKFKVDDIEFITLPSTDIGISFYFTFEGKRIYFAGDNNIWYWDEEDEHMIKDFEANIAPIKGVDIAFIPTDPRLGSHALDGAKDFIRLKNPSLLVPMHMWKDYTMAKKAKEELTVKVLEITKEGQRMEI